MAETLDLGDYLGSTTALETLKCALGFIEIGGPFLKLGTIDFGALVETCVLDRGCRWNGERLSQTEMFVGKAAVSGVSQGKQPQGLTRSYQRNAKPGAQRAGALERAPFLFLPGIGEHEAVLIYDYSLHKRKFGYVEG